MKYDGWRISKNIPTKINKKLRGQSIIVYLDSKKRTLVIQCEDVPYCLGAVVHTFNLEYVKDIKLMNGSIFIVETTFGQTGVMVP
jgi:hypothetical protein